MGVPALTVACSCGCGQRVASPDAKGRPAADLHVHHVKPFAAHPEIRLDPANLVTLCRPCHIDEHREGVKP